MPLKLFLKFFFFFFFQKRHGHTQYSYLGHAEMQAEFFSLTPFPA
ncbi:hypothetical protein E2C01_021242 [Portunus trituberculatus]|uniref:Uncharacterized protein n=1 Tax=Portunus trituberculatus TaxID=210409 RepID=A0A5B7E3P6_PORTR|nr:hypothetical protein [Portunus trituberculatus]